MRMLRLGFGLVLALGIGSLDALAAESPGTPVPTPRTGAMSPPAAPADVDGLGASVSGFDLAHVRGGTQITENMTLNGSVDHNTDNQVVTGFNQINGNAFSGAVGVPMVIQNSGNNVLIQNATIINVQFQP